MNTKQKNTLIGIAVVIVCFCLSFAAFNQFLWGGSSEPETAEEFAEEYDGSLDAYREILSSNDCDWLQGQYDTADQANQKSEPGELYYKRSLGFMIATNKRMENIGCYK